MTLRAQSLAERRVQLVLRSNARRAMLIAQITLLSDKVAATDRLIARVRSYPVVVAAIAGVAALLGPHRIFRLATRALTLYALFRRAG